MKVLDVLLVEALASSEIRPWANDVMDIVTAHSRGEVSEFEADFLLWGIEETRAPRAVKDTESLALVRRLTAAARSQIQGAKYESRPQ